MFWQQFDKYIYIYTYRQNVLPQLIGFVFSHQGLCMLPQSLCDFNQTSSSGGLKPNLGLTLRQASWFTTTYFQRLTFICGIYLQLGRGATLYMLQPSNIGYKFFARPDPLTSPNLLSTFLLLQFQCCFLMSFSGRVQSSLFKVQVWVILVAHPAQIPCFKFCHYPFSLVHVTFQSIIPFLKSTNPQILKVNQAKSREPIIFSARCINP